MSPETLLDLFVPPTGMVGHSAALVAMTGSEDFLEEAVKRFTGLGPRQRSELGNVLVYLMLDGHASSSRKQVFTPGLIPSLHEFQPRSVDPGSLLHAKIALLAFAPNRTGAPTHIRLAVLTANFTYTSARQQLELAWLVDVPLDATALAEDRAEVAAAGAFVTKLLDEHFHREPKGHRLTRRLDDLLAAAASCMQTKPLPKNTRLRFIHSLERPLYDQIKERFENAWRNSPRNLLLCGSGFYEQPSMSGAKPVVLTKLEQIDIFSRNFRRVAIVEPCEAGAMASWLANDDSGKKDDWDICQSIDVLGLNRRLHAKFIYAGYLREGRMSNGTLYIGSGNLSKRGLLTSKKHSLPKNVNGKNKTSWNIEAGVVFAVNDGFSVKNQHNKKGELVEDAISRRLFWLDSKKADLPWEVGRVGDAPEDETLIDVPPILSASIETKPIRRLHLLWREDATTTCVSLSWTGWDWFDVKRADEIPLNDDESPTALHVRVDGHRKWIVPVVDAAGRVGWQPPRFDTYADALAALLDFPISPAEAVDDDDRDVGDHNVTCGPSIGKQIEQEKNYALHAAAEFVEKVAALQTILPESMIDDWLDHLDRMFRASFPVMLITTWHTYHINVFAHLREPELRSPHLTDKQLLRYFDVLDSAARAWGLR